MIGQPRIDEIASGEAELPEPTHPEPLGVRIVSVPC